MSVGFEHPWALLLLLSLPLYAYLARRWRPHALVFSRATDVARLDRYGARKLARLPGWLRGAAVVVLTVALAAPRTGASVVETEDEGIAIVLVLDLSSSMLAEDFHPKNRLEVAKETALRFVQGRRADRIGLVAFAGEALTQVPLTSDYPVLYRAIEQLDIGLLEDGTAIGTGIATGANRLRRAPDESLVMILLTDGVNNRGEIDPMTAARAAAAYNIKIYTIGVGSQGTAPMPLARGSFGRSQYANVAVEIDEDLLRDIADLTGTRYFRATNAAGLDSIYGEIDRLEGTSVEVRRYVEYTTHYLPFVLLAGMLLVGEWLLRASRWGKVP